MSDIMFYFKVWVNNRIIVYVFYQQEPTKQTNQKIQAMIIALLTNFASINIFLITKSDFIQFCTVVC